MTYPDVDPDENHSLNALRHGWKRNAFAFAMGVCATLALPPFYIVPLIIPAFTGLLWLLFDDNASLPFVINHHISLLPQSLHKSVRGRRAFLDGWWWGWGFYITGLYWFCIALWTDPEKFGWLIPFALFGITAVIAVYSGLACWLFAKLNMRGRAGIAVFAILWTGVEYLRGHMFTGFPWNLQGYSFGFANAPLQLASLFGAYGLTFWAVLLGGSFAAFFTQPKQQAWVFTGVLWGLCMVGVLWGAWRLHEANFRPLEARYVPDVRLRLVQGNVAQSDKWDPKLLAQGVQTYVRLTQGPGLDKITHVIWPETAVPFAIRPGTVLARGLGGVVPGGAVLITGALRSAGEDKNWRIWNTIAALSHDGNLIGAYDKVQLVPFGEFLPLRWLLPASWLTPVGDTDFSSGPGAQTLSWPGLPPLRPLICYEAIFPEFLSQPRPQWLLNVTNDAWFGMSSGPHQHFEMARMRAVEQGVPLVRVANTGISGVVDAYGRVISSLALGTQGVLDASLPTALPEPPPYNRFNPWFAVILIFVALVLKIRHRSPYKN